MNKTLNKWQLAGFVFTSLAGTLLHFLYDWSGGSPIIAPFSGVNESTWEHMKLLFFPLFVFALIEYHLAGKSQRDFWCVKLSGTLLGLFLIPALYYGYTGAFGVSLDWLNIAIFYITAAAVFFWEALHFGRDDSCITPRAAIIVLIAIAIVFVLFTFFPPHIPLFRDPVAGLYGRT